MLYTQRLMSMPDFMSLKTELAVAWPLQGFIPRTEQRGITFAQLQRVAACVEKNCYQWQDRQGNPVCPDTTTLYIFNNFVILPATLDASCAFVELMTGLVQEPPVWLTSLLTANQPSHLP